MRPVSMNFFCMKSVGIFTTSSTYIVMAYKSVGIFTTSSTCQRVGVFCGFRPWAIFRTSSMCDGPAACVTDRRGPSAVGHRPKGAIL